MFSKNSESKQQSKTCTIRSWENFASAHNHAPDMQSKPVFYSLMLKAEQGLMGLGNGDGVFVCLRYVVLKQTPVLCLHALAFILHTKSQDNITEMEQLLQLSVKKTKRTPNQKVSHRTLFTQDKLSISNSTEWLVVPCSGVPGKPKTPKTTQGNPTQISNVSLTDSQDALTGNNTCNNDLTITWYINGGLIYWLLTWCFFLKTLL